MDDTQQAGQQPYYLTTTNKQDTQEQTQKQATMARVGNGGKNFEKTVNYDYLNVFDNYLRRGTYVIAEVGTTTEKIKFYLKFCEIGIIKFI